MKSGSILIISALVLLILSACSEGKKSDQEPRPGRKLDYTHQVTFLNKQEEPIITIDVAIADEADERQLGLMDVNDLPSDKGMLFIFEEQELLNFWMANTPLSLDIIFVNEDHEIVRIHHSTQPFTERDFSSGAPARYVVETNGGFCVSHDIQEGMQVEWKEIQRLEVGTFKSTAPPGVLFNL